MTNVLAWWWLAGGFGCATAPRCPGAPPDARACSEALATARALADAAGPATADRDWREAVDRADHAVRVCATPAGSDAFTHSVRLKYDVALDRVTRDGGMPYLEVTDECRASLAVAEAAATRVRGADADPCERAAARMHAMLAVADCSGTFALDLDRADTLLKELGGTW